MTLKILGAFLVVAGCGGFGFLIAAAYRREVKSLQQLILALEYMSSQLQYKMTLLPELCQQTADASKGTVKTFFSTLSRELMRQVSPNVKKCVEAALVPESAFPRQTCALLTQLGDCLGCFDLDGQLKGLASVRAQAESALALRTQDQDVRLRSYQTLGLCAGAAMAILFI